ncbi:MAG: hypothetical protein PGN13_07465 [Patulibacter minatonensis]
MADTSASSHKPGRRRAAGQSALSACFDRSADRDANRRPELVEGALTLRAVADGDIGLGPDQGIIHFFDRGKGDLFRIWWARLNAHLNLRRAQATHLVNRRMRPQCFLDRLVRGRPELAQLQAARELHGVLVEHGSVSIC